MGFDFRIVLTAEYHALLEDILPDHLPGGFIADDGFTDFRECFLKVPVGIILKEATSVPSLSTLGPKALSSFIISLLIIPP